MQGTAAEVKEARPAEVLEPGRGGGTVTPPDVCGSMPAAPSAVPVPYPRMDRAGDAGAKAVKVEGGDVMTEPRPPAPPTSGDEPGTAGPAGITGRAPGPLKGADPFVVAGLVVALVAAIMVATGDVGWAEARVLPFPVGEVEPIGPVTYVKYRYGVYDGDLHTPVIVTTVLLLALSAVATLVALRGTRSRRLSMVGMGLAAGALVVSIAGALAFDAWAKGEGFVDWGFGSSIWAGAAGSLMVVVLYSFPMVRALSARRGAPG